MKDYSKIEGIKKNLQDEANNIFDKGYQQGFHDGEDSYLVVKRKPKDIRKVCMMRGNALER